MPVLEVSAGAGKDIDLQCLKKMKSVAKDKAMLSEHFIRELNKIILVRDFYKTSRDGEYRYKINVGVYKNVLIL